MVVDQKVLELQKKNTNLMRFIGAILVEQEGYVYVSDKSLIRANTGQFDHCVIQWEKVPGGHMISVVDPNTGESPFR